MVSPSLHLTDGQDVCLSLPRGLSLGRGQADTLPFMLITWVRMGRRRFHSRCVKTS